MTNKDFNTYIGYDNPRRTETIQLNNIRNENQDSFQPSTSFRENSHATNVNYSIAPSMFSSPHPNNLHRQPTPVPYFMNQEPSSIYEEPITNVMPNIVTTRLNRDNEFGTQRNNFPLPILANNIENNNSEETKFGLPPSFPRTQENSRQSTYQQNNQNNFNRGNQVEEGKEKTNLEKLFSSSSFSKKITTSDLKYFRIYENAKKFLTMDQSSSSIHPMNMLKPYSEVYKSKVGNISLVSNLGTKKKKAELQIFLYKSENNNNEYVMKRYVHFCNLISKDLSELEDLEKFISSKYIEYSLMKFYSTCPYSTNPIFFNIVQIKNVGVIVTELMMDYAGTSILDSYPITVSQLAYDYLYQLIMAINFLKEFHIENNGIYPSNIMVRNIGNKIIIKLIDFNIDWKQTDFKESSITNSNKSNLLYWAPELLSKKSKGSQMGGSVYSHSKVQIY